MYIPVVHSYRKHIVAIEPDIKPDLQAIHESFLCQQVVKKALNR